MIEVKIPDFNRMEMAFTKNCLQSGWNAKYYFPYCPQESGNSSLESYFKRLNIGIVFAFNDEAPNLIITEVVNIKSSLLVMCEREGIICERLGFHPWLIVEITFENDLFVHLNLGSYFEKEDADDNFALYRA